MKTVWKFPLQLRAEPQKITAPGLGRIVHFAIQNGDLCLWAEVIQVEPDRSMSVRIFGTGNRIPEPFEHCGTVQDGGLVWHLYREPAVEVRAA
jgi:hypothetical protein